MPRTPEQIQHDFYTATSQQYDEMHVNPSDEHYTALKFVSALITGFGYRSVLDVGAGTGRGIRHFLDHHSELEVRGLEPVEAMIEQAERRNGVPPGCIIGGTGSPSPFADNEFDAVCEFGVLHHVADPNAIVAEMARVARKAVFLSDENRFARGGRISQAVKFGIHRAGLWPSMYRVITRGRSYRLTEGDGGVAYSYSVYDSLPVLQEWADRVFLVPTGPTRSGDFHPMFGAHHILLCAIKDD